MGHRASEKRTMTISLTLGKINSFNYKKVYIVKFDIFHIFPCLICITENNEKPFSMDSGPIGMSEIK